VLLSWARRTQKSSSTRKKSSSSNHPILVNRRSSPEFLELYTDSLIRDCCRWKLRGPGHMLCGWSRFEGLMHDYGRKGTLHQAIENVVCDLFDTRAMCSCAFQGRDSNTRSWSRYIRRRPWEAFSLFIADQWSPTGRTGAYGSHNRRCECFIV
jgi:hypothetical protein